MKPIGYLQKNAARLVRDVAENQRTVMITDEGQAKAVVMDVETYERWRAALNVLELLAHSEAEIRAGRVVTHEVALARAETRLKAARRDA